MSTPATCEIVRLGTLDYQQAWDLQVGLVQAVYDGNRPNTLLLLEHPHVYTKGRLSQPEQLLLTPAEMDQKGIGLVETDRGGLVTYHGPGQVVAYPVVNLRNWGGPLQYVRTLEQIIIQVLADLGIEAGLAEGLTGVWVGGAKIAAIGVKISRGVAYHGFAINVNTDLSYFDHIIPCGINDRSVTSIAQVLDEALEMPAGEYTVAYQFGKAMGFKMVEADANMVLSAVSRDETPTR